MWLFRMYAFLHFVPFEGLFFVKSTEIKSLSDMLGFPLDKYKEKMFEICPYTNFCTKPAHTNFTYNFGGLGPCCPPCSCNPNCFLKENCCIDAVLSTETYKFDILDHVDCSYVDLNAKVPNAYIRYRVVVSCTNDIGEKLSCSKTIKKTTRPEDIVLVSSKDGFVIFLNEDCARCHGITDIIRWKFSVRECADDLYTLGLTGKALFSYAMENCTIFSQPPDDFDDSELTCGVTTKTIIDKCEDGAGEELIQLCDNQIVPQFDQRQVMFGDLYKNVFCYMCNVPNNHTFYTECYGAIVVFTPLSYILNLDINTYDDPSGETDGGHPGKHCYENEFRDPFLDVCRQLQCPFPNRTQFNTCKKPPVVPEKTTMLLSFTIRLQQIVNAVDKSDWNTKFKLSIEDFTNISNLTQCKSIIFKQTYYVSKSNQVLEYIVVEIDFRRTSTCGINVLYDIFSTNELLIDDKISFSVFNTTVQNYTLIRNFPFSPEDVSKYSVIPEVWLYDIESYTTKDLFAINTEESKFYFVQMEALPCPHIHLNETEYLTLISKIEVSNEIRQDKEREQKVLQQNTTKVIEGFISREYHTDRESKTVYFVCIETYVSLALKTSVNKDKYPIKGIVTLTLSIPSIICILICFVVYSKTANTRSLPSKVFRTALVNLFIAQCIFQFGVERTSLPFPICATIGALAHFFWLSAVFSLNAFCVVVAVKLHVINDGTEANISGIIKALFFVYGLSALFVGGNVIYSMLVNDTVGYGLKLCYIDEALMRLLLFALPIFCTVIVNCFVYIYIIYTISSTSSMAGRKSNDVKYATLYFRLLLITGVAWMFGFLNEYFSSDVLDYWFIVLIGGQGLFLFFVFNFGRMWSKLQTCLALTQVTSDITTKTGEKN